MRVEIPFAAALALLCVCAPAVAQDCDVGEVPGTVYGLAQDGRMSVNGTTTATYGSDTSIDIDTDDDWIVVIGPGGGIYIDPPVEITVENPQSLWSSLDSDGSDRYALKRDGRMKKNDKKVYDLPWQNNTYWLDMAATGGSQYSIRSDGQLAIDDRVVIDRNSNGFAFRRLVVADGDVYVLRGDGNVYRNQEFDPLFTFRAGAGDLGALDGEILRTTWSGIAVDPAGEFVYAIRTDGYVRRGRLAGGTQAGESVAELPYIGFELLNYGERYVDLVFTTDGTWYALQGDGRVYTDRTQPQPLVDLPGQASQIDRIHVDLDVLDDNWFSLRSDGRIYLNGNEEEILDLASEYYGSMSVSRDPPVLKDDGSTKKPKATMFKTKTVVGTPLRLPVVVTDLDTCPDEISIVPTKLPEGAVWDAENRTFVWDAPGPKGEYKFKFDCSDGINTKSYKFTLKVKNPDDNPDKNVEPKVASYDGAQAVIGLEYALLIVADDRDGDVLAYSVDETQYPFNAGATFDPETRLFRWTPTAEDQGTQKVKFSVSDGLKTKKVKLEIKVKFSLLN